MNALYIAIISALIAPMSQAAVIAIIDSGTDLTHSQLKNKKWVNPNDVDDAVDEDDNGYIDDIHGWNFADQNNKLIDKKFLGTFSTDVTKFFEVQTRLITGTATQEDRDWMAAARANTSLIAELQIFGNFVHGTHVAGIAAQGSSDAKIMGLKIMPTKSPIGGRPQKADGKLIRMALSALAAQQGKALAPIGQYVAKKKARLANCSFGTSTHAAKQLLAPLLKLLLRREATEAELNEYSSFFVSEVIKAAAALVTPAKDKTLFIMAAGNDGMDNDQFPTSPANFKSNNTIAVAATFGHAKLAQFSNYGSTMVEVAAPGVGILSSIPGEQQLTVSGTSQAAPYVTNLAAKILDANPNLSNSDLKKLLIQTSDLKDFLKGKVVSGGIVNEARATTAAKLALTMQMDAAIASAHVQVSDVQVNTTGFQMDEGLILPLPTLFE